MEEPETFANFVAKNIEKGKEALKQKPFVSAHQSATLEDILNEKNVIPEEEDELTTFTQQSQKKSQDHEGESQSATFEVEVTSQP